MVGRAYTMKEMKQIVDYLVEHRAYNEIRGRKMWIDLVSSKILDRTWQSLKETFLKRILQDIHNPYYKLTVEQIASFRQECDIGAKNQRKLEIQTISDSSSSDIQRAKEQVDKKEDGHTGEDKCSKIQNRTSSSTETLVLENCYETAEDIQKELESPNKSAQTQKSLRDFITYSEPLTPMLQEVLHDFSSDDEPQMQIVEEPETLPTFVENDKSKSPETIRESQSYTKKTENIDNGDEPDQKTQTSKIKSLKLKKTRKGTWENKEPVGDVASTVQEKEANNNDSEMVFTGQENTKSPKINAAVTDKNHSNSTIDTQLPNNQEGLGDNTNQNRKSTESSNSDFVDSRKKKKDKARKRSRSQSSVERKKNKKNKAHESSETQEQEKDTVTYNSHPQATTIQNELVNGIQIVQDLSNNKSELTNDTNIPPNVVVKNTAAKSNEGTSQEAGPSGVNPEDINPCLKSVSLYEEQFSQSKYSDSDDNIAPIDTPRIDTPKRNHEQETVVNSHSKDTSTENEQVTIENNHGNDTSKETDVSNLLKESVINGIENATTSKNLGIDDVVLLKSHSETSSEHLDVAKKKAPVSRIKKSRETALANVFGFASGGVYKRPMNHSKSSSRRFSQQRHRINSRTYNNVDSGSSDDYTTASDSDDSRNHGHRKYVKPSSFDILSHENGLYVVGRKKIYPLLLREKGSLHYACSAEGIDNEQADSYWKTKYLEEKQKLAEEKIRADELARLLRKAHEVEEDKKPKSPILQANQSLNTFVNKNQASTNQAKEAVTEREHKPEEKVKIKFNRNKDIELEGQWTNINPILERMVEIFKNNDAQEAKTKQDTVSITEEKPVTGQKENAQSEKIQTKTKKSLSLKTSAKEKSIHTRDSDEKDVTEITDIISISSGKSTPNVVTPADLEVHKKVNMLESEIFQKIAEIEKTDQSIHENNLSEASNDTNITKRKRGRPKKIIGAIRDKTRSSISLDTAPKSIASSVENISKKTKPPPRNKATLSEDPSKNTKARTLSEGPAKRTKTRTLSEGPAERTEARTLSVTPGKRIISRTLSEGPSKRNNLTSDSEAGTSKRFTKAPKKFGSDDHVDVEPKRIKPLPKSKASMPRPDTPTDEVSIPEDDEVRYMFPPKTKKMTRAERPRRYTIIAGRTLTSTYPRQSSTDYQDSDLTSPNINITRRKKKMTTATLVQKKGYIRKVRRKSCPYLADDDSCSTNESQSQKSDTIRNTSQTTNSEVYKSDSYQLLMPRTKQLNHLDIIDENPVANETETNKNNLNYLNPLTINVTTEFHEQQNNSRQKGSEANSSNISLLLSPELSIVENLSVSKDLISSSLECPPSINETDMNNEELPTITNKYLMSGVDVSMPLMEQECGFQTKYKNKPRNRRTTFSESLEQEQYSSESLDQKLRDLLLESAKKISQDHTEGAQDMEVDTVASEKKTKAIKRRSSTPSKKKTVLRSKTPEVNPVIEEYTESCSHSGRQSCPPVIQITPCEATDNNLQANMTNNNETTKKIPFRGRKKKDVIKVKILRPRSKSTTKVVTHTHTHTSRLSICTDSGINDTESGVSEGCQCCDISTELIHNHSDTCLHMDECVGDSLEIVEDANQSVISLNSNSIPSEILSGNINSSKDTSETFVTPEMFCSNAQDATSLKSAKKPQQRDGDEAATAYFTPPSGESFNSLITDDLSDEVKHSPTKWYLVNEQETNFVDTCSRSSSAGVRANLNKIFTPCAVPDLSTISERSRENDTKVIINTDAEPDVISQSLFDFEF